MTHTILICKFVLNPPLFSCTSAQDLYTARLGGVYGNDCVEPPFCAGHDCIAIVKQVTASAAMRMAHLVSSPPGLPVTTLAVVASLRLLQPSTPQLHLLPILWVCVITGRPRRQASAGRRPGDALCAIHGNLEEQGGRWTAQ